MTPEQSRKLKMLSDCTFQPGSWPKRFVRMLQSQDFANADMTPKQAYWIDRLYYMYRGQIRAYLDFWNITDAPPFVDPPLPLESVTIDDGNIQQATQYRESQREAAAKARLARWNENVQSRDESEDE